MYLKALRNIQADGRHIAAGSTFSADSATATALIAMGKAVEAAETAVDLTEPAAGDLVDAPRRRAKK